METLFTDRLLKTLKTKRISQAELAKATGISPSSISEWIKGKYMPKQDKIALIAKALNVSPAWLIGYDYDQPIKQDLNFAKKGVRIPILGQVVAGIPIDAIEDIEGYEEITQEMAATGEFFCLRVKGDSMEPTFKEGDILVIRQQPCVDSNEIAIVIVNGNEGTVKRIKKSEAGITLIGDNTASFLPVFYTNEEIQQLPVKIVGKVVELRRSF